MTAPSVGRIVHYTSLGDRDGKYPPEIQSALITGVKPRDAANGESSLPQSYVVDLRVFYRTGDFWMLDVPFTSQSAGSDDARGKWAWPARDPSRSF